MSFSPLRRLPRSPGKTACCTMLLAAALPMATPARAEIAVSGSAALTTDYVWRGTSQTDGDPAAQAGVKLSGGRGWYASAWASSVRFAPESGASSELDLVAGWSGPLSADWTLDLNLTHYRYPSSAVDLDWTEAIATLTWRQLYWLQIGRSGDALASGDGGSYAQLGAKLPLGDRVRLEAAVGRYWLDGATTGRDDGYAHAQLGAVWTLRAPLELRLTLHDTDAAAKCQFPGLAGSRVEAALQASF